MHLQVYYVIPENACLLQEGNVKSFYIINLKKKKKHVYGEHAPAEFIVEWMS